MIEKEIEPMILMLRDNEWLSNGQQGLTSYIFSLLHPKEKVKEEKVKEEQSSRKEGVVAEKITDKLPFF